VLRLGVVSPAGVRERAAVARRAVVAAHGRRRYQPRQRAASAKHAW
jgi:hypothetical protein